MYGHFKHLKEKNKDKRLYLFMSLGRRSLLLQDVNQILCFSPRILKSLPPLSLAGTRLLLVVQKRPCNRSDRTLALRWELWCSDVGESWFAKNKHIIFPEHPVYIKTLTLTTLINSLDNAKSTGCPKIIARRSVVHVSGMDNNLETALSPLKLDPAIPLYASRPLLSSPSP